LDVVAAELDRGAWGLGARPDRLAFLDPRARLIVAVLFALAVVSLSALDVAFVALLVGVALAWLGGVSVARLRYLLPLELLMLVLLLTLPLSLPGRPLLVLGPIVVSAEGLALAGLILLRANAVVLGLFGLVGAIGSSQTVHALAQLGVPAKLCQLSLLTLRQIALVGDEYQRMRSAMRARAFVARTDRHSWRVLGWLIGMLLVRSLERGRRVSEAMRCRGFAGSWPLLRGRSWQFADSLFLALGAAACFGLLLLDQWPMGI
jgi:cobalt/nickel transport system permease protein